jgi:hypothetical protein
MVVIPTIRLVAGTIIVLSLWLAGCGDKAPQQVATLTFKRDGSHFTGAVVRKDPNSITLTGPAGDTHTFLNEELSDIRFETPQAHTAPADNSPSAPANNSKMVTPSAVAPKSPSAPHQAGAPSAETGAAGPSVTLPAGTEFPVRSDGFLDSCCVPVGALAVGAADADVKGPGGKIAIPAGANVLFELLETKNVNGQVTMTFQLDSADFGGHHYRIASTEGALSSGARITLLGAKENSPEARVRGTNVHVDARGLIVFKAVTPITVRLES